MLIPISLSSLDIPSNITLHYIRQVTTLLDENFTLRMILINFKPTNPLGISAGLKDEYVQRVVKTFLFLNYSGMICDEQFKYRGLLSRVTLTPKMILVITYTI